MTSSSERGRAWRLQSTLLQFPSGSTLYDRDHPPKNVIFIESGFVKVGTADNVVLDYLGPGDICGVHCLEKTRSNQTVRALTDVVVVSIPEARETTVVCRNHNLAARIVKGLIRRMLRYEESIIDLVTEPTEKRLAKLLLRFETRGVHGWAEIPNLTNPEIASKVGTTRWQVSRHINRLRHLNIVRRGPGLRVNFELLRAFLNRERCHG